MTQIEKIQKDIQDMETALAMPSINDMPKVKKRLQTDLNTAKSTLAQLQKKSESQPSINSEQVKRNPIRDASAKVPQEVKDGVRKWADQVQQEAEIQDPSYVSEYVKFEKGYFEKNPLTNIKTVKAPAFVAPDELINVELEDSKGNKQTKTFSKAQVRALTRKYFSNVHESWLGKERKMGVGFKNLLAYVVAWKEFDNEMPSLRDVLPDYDRYSKGGDGKEPSETFKVAQELYQTIDNILNKKA